MLVLLVYVCLLSGRVADGRPREEDLDDRPGHVDSFRKYSSVLPESYKKPGSAYLVAAATEARKWPGLRTTFGMNPLGGFFRPQPRTVAEAESSGWSKISSCDDGGKFLGNRYIEKSGHSFILIFDDAGYIAGSQSVVLTRYVNDRVAFSHPAYQLDHLRGSKAYFTTAYFVDPARICNGGRSEADFTRDGTGDRLLIQVGKSADKLQKIPELEADALAEANWYEHKCLPAMGKHVIGFNYAADQDCDEVIPLQILYYQGKLSGFIWTHYAKIPQDPARADIWEYPPVRGVRAIVDQPPSCLIEQAKSPGVSSMHHYFLNKPWLTKC